MLQSAQLVSPSSIGMPNDERGLPFKKNNSRPFSIVGNALIVNNGLQELSKDTFALYLKVLAPRRLKYIYISDSVTVIHSKTFHGLNSVVGVVFGANSQLTSLAMDAFPGTLLHINIPERVMIINRVVKPATHDCLLRCVSFAPGSRLDVVSNATFLRVSIESMTIPASVTELESEVFMYCKNLQHVMFEAGSQLTTIGSKAFFGAAIISITIPREVQYIGDNVFSSCNKLKTVKFESDCRLTRIGKGAFMCSAITSICIPSSVQVIDKSAFFQCQKLHDFVFGDEFYANGASLTIESDALVGSALDEIDIPPCVTHIGSGFLSDCGNLRHVTIRFPLPDNIAASKLHTAGWLSNRFRSKHGSPVRKEGKIIRGLQCEVCLNGVDWRLIDAYTQRWEYFEGGEFRPVEPYVPIVHVRDFGLDIVEIDPFFLTILSKDVAVLINCRIRQNMLQCAFGDSFSHVNKIILAPGVEKVPYRAFACCKNIQVVSFPPESTLKHIDKEAFCGCGITEICLPASLEKIGYGALSRGKFSVITFDANPQLRIIENHAFAGNHELKELTVPSSVGQIGEFAFAECDRMAKFTFSGNNVEISTGIFFNCRSLKAISLYHISGIQKGAFAGSYLTDIVFISSEGLSSNLSDRINFLTNIFHAWSASVTHRPCRVTFDDGAVFVSNDRGVWRSVSAS
jgi:hypothetical protein